MSNTITGFGFFGSAGYIIGFGGTTNQVVSLGGFSFRSGASGNMGRSYGVLAPGAANPTCRPYK